MKLLAPAKVTWTLHVTGRREDGYHFLRSEMVTVDLCDVIDIDESANYFVVRGAPHEVPDGPDNLVRRALALVGRSAGIELVKEIPTGGGLGGGSSDAAAILRWAGGVTPAQAATLGADVPFCQVGGRALVEGIGDVVTPLDYHYREITLLLPDFAISTAEVYRSFDELGTLVRDTTNDLEIASATVEPRLGRLLEWARAQFDDVRLCGSGSTIFVVGHVFDQPRGDVQGPDGRLRWIQAVTQPPY